MIRLEGVAKTFPGSPRPAVERVDLDVAEGSTLVLIGPSGCGKSTTLQFVNRLVAPDRGRVLVGGRDVAGLDPVRLRRGIGYVLQGIGLFPHRSVGENVATVPRLLGWPRAKVADRVEAMLDLVGLDPRAYRDRRPAQLSGGQQQRVGVARALAADPPVLLMDEPFGALDPVVRTHLQGELRAILARLRKTVVFVTHDIDEAVRVGDRVAVMREGRLVQVAAPADLLAAPADAFVADFVGADRALKRLALLPAAPAAEPAAGGPGGGAATPAIPASATLREALAALVAGGGERVAIAGTPAALTFAGIQAAARRPSPEAGP